MANNNLMKRAALFQPHRKEVSGTDSITLENPITAPISKLVVEGRECVQRGIPTPAAPKEIVCGNGVLRYCANLANVIEENISVGYYISDTGTIYSHNANFYYTPFVSVEPNTAYTLTADSELYFISISEYDENQTFIKRTGAYAKELTITTGANTHFLRFGSNISNSKLTLATILAITWTLNRGNHYVQPGTVYVDTSPTINLACPRIDSDQGWYISSGVVANATSANRTVIIPCKPNTTYTWWHSEGLGGTRAFVLNSNDITLGQPASWVVSNPVHKEANELTSYTTGADAHILCICYGRVDNTSTRTFAEQANDFMVVEGELTATIPYVAGSGNMAVTVRQRSKKNLFPYPTYSEILASPKHATTNYNNIELQLKPNTTYHLSTTYLNGYTSVGEDWYGLITWDPDSNNQWWAFAHHTIGIKDGNITTGETGKLYIRITSAKLTQEKLDNLYANAQIQLEEGNSATTFEPYETVSYYNTEPLLAIGNCKDTQDLARGRTAQRIGVIVLDGTEGWSEKNEYGGHVTLKISNMSNKSSASLIVTHGEWAKAPGKNSDKWSIIGSQLAYHPSQETTDEFKVWLAAQYAAGTPVMVLYPFMNPVNKWVTQQLIKTKYKFDTIIDTNGAISARYWQPPF